MVFQIPKFRRRFHLKSPFKSPLSLSLWRISLAKCFSLEPGLVAKPSGCWRFVVDLLIDFSFFISSNDRLIEKTNLRIFLIKLAYRLRRLIGDRVWNDFQIFSNQRSPRIAACQPQCQQWTIVFATDLRVLLFALWIAKLMNWNRFLMFILKFKFWTTFQAQQSKRSSGFMAERREIVLKKHLNLRFLRVRILKC